MVSAGFPVGSLSRVDPEVTAGLAEAETVSEPGLGELPPPVTLAIVTASGEAPFPVRFP